MKFIMEQLLHQKWQNGLIYKKQKLKALFYSNSLLINLFLKKVALMTKVIEFI